jgi:lysyl-tRNA synthetase class I
MSLNNAQLQKSLANLTSGYHLGKIHLFMKFRQLYETRENYRFLIPFKYKHYFKVVTNPWWLFLTSWQPKKIQYGLHFRFLCILAKVHHNKTHLFRQKLSRMMKNILKKLSKINQRPPPFPVSLYLAKGAA